MKQEKRKTFNNISKNVNSTRSKLKQTTITTPIKNAPLTAKVDTTWNNVLNKNKKSTNGKISTSHKYIINLATNDPVRSLRFFVIELKSKIDILLPGNRAVKNIMDNILKTCSKIEQPFKIQNPLNNSMSLKSQILKPQSSEKKIDEMQLKNDRADVIFKEIVEENSKAKLKKENIGQDSEVLILKRELNSSIQRVEKLESALNESVNTERVTIANYEQQCKRLQNEIKTLQDSARQQKFSDPSAVKQRQKMDKFKYQIKMALHELEKEKLKTILKYDENQMNASHSEFCNIYELIQKFFSSDYGDQVQIKFNCQSDKKN